jgi:DNA-binding NarL/FixJ family response regulator
MSEQLSEGIIRVVLADDQRLLRDGLRIILEAAPDFAVVGEAEDGLAAVELAAAAQPDVLLLDIRMPRLDGIEAARRIAQVAPATRVVLLTTFDMPDLVTEGVQAGIAGFLLKDSSAEELRAAVRAVARGQLLFQGQSAAHLLARAALPAAPASSAGERFDLTERELEVVRGISQGQTNAEIAAELVVSEATVKTHINHIFAKLGVRDRAHAILLAQQHHLA